MSLPIEVTIAEDKSKATFHPDTWMGITSSTMKLRDMDNKPMVHTGSCIMFKNSSKINVMEKYEDLRDTWMLSCGAQP